MNTTQTNLPETLNPNQFALLIIDVQQGLFRKSTPIYKAEEFFYNIQTLIDRAHRAGAPVFYVQHSDQKALVKGSQDWQLYSKLCPAEADMIIHKTHGNAFEDTILDQELKSRNIGNLVVMGLVTHGCVKATCIGAKNLGYQVLLVKDGHSNYSKQAAHLIEEWNQKLSNGIVELRLAAKIGFDKGRNPL